MMVSVPTQRTPSAPFSSGFYTLALFSSDAEIAALEGKPSKARQVKAGMMSVSLTGRARLV